MLLLDTTVPLRGEDMRTVGSFDIRSGEEVGFTLSWTPSFLPAPAPLKACPWCGTPLALGRRRPFA